MKDEKEGGGMDRVVGKKTVVGLWAILSVLVLFCSLVDASEKRVFTDMTGRQVEIKFPVQRIVTTFKPATLCVFSLGLADHLVGVDSSSRMDRLQKIVYPDISKVTLVGRKATGISFETLVGLKPDVVILYSQKDGLALAERLKKIHIPSLMIIPESYDTIKAAMRLIADTAGVEDRMRKIGKLMDSMLSLINERISGIEARQRKKAYFASSMGLFSTTTGNMLQHEMIVKAGLVNVSEKLTGYFQTISPEQLVRWNPDIMILSQHAPDGETARLSEPVLSAVHAVSQRQVYRCPSSLAPWDFPSPLSVLSSLWLAKKAYPRLFDDVDIKARADVFHKALFGKTMTGMQGAINEHIDF